jgi:hypothetical protein
VYGNLMRELSGERVDMLRTAHKLLKPTYTMFKGVEK